MSLTLKISLTEQKNSFIVNDCTDVFSSSNKGGYGGINEKVSDITDAYLLIDTPESTESIRIDVFPDFPNVEGSGFEVFPYMVNLSEIVSGVYNVKLFVSVTDKNGREVTKTASSKEVFLHSITCCIDSHKNILTTDAFVDEKQKTVIELDQLLEVACWAKDCGLYDKASKIIKYLNAQCVCIDCK